MATGKKFYVVFCGRNPGVYDNWDDAKEQVESYPGALYKGYSTSEEAAMAYRKSVLVEDAAELRRLIGMASAKARQSVPAGKISDIADIDHDAWAVDASCLGNPGRMEYRGVEVATGRELFRIGPFEDGTNNIGEFLAIVHAMALMTRKGEFHNIYSDSKTGMSWVRNRKVKTQLKTTPRNGKLFELLARGELWLQSHTFPARVMKWETEKWGEIPADFGRK